MVKLGRFAVAALVFTGAAAAGAYAAGNQGFHDRITSVVSGVTDDIALARELVAGDEHLAYAGDDVGVSKRDEDRIASSSVVTHVEVVGGGARQRIVLLDPDGREVFSHDPEANTTIIAKDVVIPSITVRDDPSATAELRVVTAASSIEAPDELVQALNTGAEQSELFYRDEL